MKPTTGSGSRLIFGGLLLLVLWLPLPFGSNRDWAIAIMGLATFLLLGAWSTLALAGRVRIPASLSYNWPVNLLWVIWLAYVCSQLFPLNEGRASLAPATTYQHLLESVTYFGIYLLVLLTASGRPRMRLLAGTLVLSGVFQAVYGSVMTLSGLEYGFIEKKVHNIGDATGTFINRNHLAGYLEFCAAVAVGLIVADLKGGLPKNWRAALRDFVELLFSRKLRNRIFLGMMVIGLVLTHSRTGNVAFFTSLMLCGCLYVLLRERRLFVRSLLLLSSFLIIDLLIVSQWFGLEEVVERVEQTNIETEGRAYILPELSLAVEKYWLMGSGLGTFSIAILPFRKVMPHKYFDHAHNDYAEFLIEVGVIGFLILLTIVVITAVHALRVMLSRRNRLRTGVALAGLMSIVSIGIHSTVDFNLQIPSNAATFVIILAMVNACSHVSRGKVGNKAHASPSDNERPALEPS